MKTKKQMAVVTAALLWINLAGAQTTTNYTFNVNRAIPDADPNGFAVTANLTGISGTIINLTVSLDITGGFNGDLYAYLAGPNGGFVVLLNRPGVTGTGSAFGYADAGFNVTFDDSAANGSIHYYQNIIQPNGGQLTGIWQPDGANIDPQSSPSAFLTAGQTAMLASFNGNDPNGAWTLFLADLSAGGQSTFVSWGLTISTVPEPGSMALVGFSLCFLVAARKWLEKA
jgi:subtilisin-like proprotein convertase family protein